MALKPEQVRKTRDAKRASVRRMRRAAKRDPEDAPRRTIVRGWAD